MVSHGWLEWVGDAAMARLERVGYGGTAWAWLKHVGNGWLEQVELKGAPQCQ